MFTKLITKAKVLGLVGTGLAGMAMAPAAANADGHFRIGLNIAAPVYVAPACPAPVVVAPVYATPVYAPVYSTPVYVPAPVCTTPVYVPAPICAPVIERPVIVERRPAFFEGWHRGWDRRR